MAEFKPRDLFHRTGVDNPGIHCIPIPTPFPVGRINTYLIEGDPPALIDTGPHSDVSLAVLRRGLRYHGYALEDLGDVVITHPHIDHFGLAETVRQETGATVHVPQSATRAICEYETNWFAGDAFMESFFPVLGVPDENIQVMRQIGEPMRQFGRAVEKVETFSDGDAIRLDSFTIKTVHTPGHTPHCMSLFIESHGIAFTGDFLLRRISSNPVMTPPDEKTGKRPHPLLNYMGSLAKVESMNIALALPGHGLGITDHREVIQRLRGHHAHRASRILKLIAESPSTPYDISVTLFPNLSLGETFLGISEVMAHLDWLVERGDAVWTEEKGVRRYAKA